MFSCSLLNLLLGLHMFVCQRGLTALFVAAERGYEKILKILLECGAKTNMQDGVRIFAAILNNYFIRDIYDMFSLSL